MNVGDEWIYRLRDVAPSERVRILDIERRKQSVRVTVEFLDGDNQGTVENVPGGRLRSPWSEVAAYDKTMSNWQRIGEYTLTTAEKDAVSIVFELLVPEEMATCGSGWSQTCVEISEPTALEPVAGWPIETFVDAVASFQDDDGSWCLSAEGAVLIAEAACKTNPMPILAWVIAEERTSRAAAKRGTERTRFDGDRYTSDPTWEFEWYRERDRPVHELLRQWCGHRAITVQERLMAAEAEVHRLDELLASAADSMRDNKLDHLGTWLDEEHDRDQITPYNVRPIVERPLRLDEIPVRTEYRRARWRS